MNNQGLQKTRPRKVLGQKVLIRQQPPAPLPNLEVLLLSYQMLSQFVIPDKYFECKIMPGYILSDFANDAKDSLFDLHFPYVVVFLNSPIGCL